MAKYRICIQSNQDRIYPDWNIKDYSQAKILKGEYIASGFPANIVFIEWYNEAEYYTLFERSYQITGRYNEKYLQGLSFLELASAINIMNQSGFKSWSIITNKTGLKESYYKTDKNGETIKTSTGKDKKYYLDRSRIESHYSDIRNEDRLSVALFIPSTNKIEYFTSLSDKVRELKRKHKAQLIYRYGGEGLQSKTLKSYKFIQGHKIDTAGKFNQEQAMLPWINPYMVGSGNLLPKQKVKKQSHISDIGLQIIRKERVKTFDQLLLESKDRYSAGIPLKDIHKYLKSHGLTQGHRERIIRYIIK